MCLVNNGKQKMSYDGRNRCAKSRQNQNIRTLGKTETFKYLAILETHTIRRRFEKNIKKEYQRRRRKLLETKLHCRNIIKEINV